MNLEPNTRLGPYEIVSAIGAGGMGEVYRARDERLGRDVAIKILPQIHTDSDERLSRFEQEARATGALNHPNVVAVYDVGRHDGAPYVVTELLSGETLRERLRVSTLTPRRAVDYAVQIARGLAAAHEKGIVHRDIKPENLFLTTDGRVKILDFGLAKVTTEIPIGADSTVQTLRAPTNPGVVMGTVGYMSPEQVRGLPVDHRTDIFSLGAVLYEMLTGQRAFAGDSAIEIMNSILKEDPPEITSLMASVPLGLDRVVRHCLEKHADARFQSASDLAFDLEAQSLYSGSLTSAARPTRGFDWRRLWPVAAMLALVVAGLAGAAIGRAYMSAAELSAPTYSQLTFRKGSVMSARFAPDGQTVVYSAAWDGKQSNLYLVGPGNPETRSLELPDTHVLAISKTGELAVIREGTLSRMALTGGAPRAVLEHAEGADWSPVRNDLAVIHWVDGKFRLEYPIGTVVYQSDTVLSSPRFSPDGRHIAFFNHPIKGDDRGSVMVASLDGATRPLSEGWTSLGGLAWSPTGTEIWFAGARTGANRSLHSLALDGSSRLVSSVAGSIYLLDVTPDGRALVARENHRSEIMSHTQGEKADRELSWLDGSLATDISRDGQTLLFSELNHGGGTNYSAYIRKVDGSAPAVRLGDGNGTSLSPDGRHALTILPTTPPQLVLLPTGAGEQRVLVSGGLDQIATARWFPDGQRVVLVGQEAGKTWRSYVVDVATGSIAPLTPENVKGALMSPDGRLLAAHDGNANRWVLFPVEGGDLQPITGLQESEGPIQWSADGRSLYIREVKQFPARLFKLNPTTGSRELVAELAPSDMTGIKPYPRSVVITPDGRTHAYTFMRVASELYMLEGCKEWCRDGLDTSFMSVLGGPA